MRKPTAFITDGTHVKAVGSPWDADNMTGWTRITYNPYKYDSFVRASDEWPVTGADEVRLVIRNGRARIYARGVHLREETLAA